MKNGCPKIVTRITCQFLWGTFCGTSYSGENPCGMILLANDVQWYYWPTMFNDTFDYCKRCEVYQAFANKFTVSGNLHLIPPLGPFEKWDIDLMDPLPVTRRGHHFIVVATDYFTKFVEVWVLKIFVKEEVAWFVYKCIVTCFIFIFRDGIE